MKQNCHKRNTRFGLHLVYNYSTGVQIVSCTLSDDSVLSESTGLFIIALRWWFCPCRVGGAVWNHKAWLFPLMLLPTLSLFYSYFLSGNAQMMNIKKHHLKKYWAMSVLYQFTTIEVDLEICIMSKALKSKMIRRCCIHSTFGKTMGPHVTMATQLIVSWHWQML